MIDRPDDGNDETARNTQLGTTRGEALLVRSGEEVARDIGNFLVNPEEGNLGADDIRNKLIELASQAAAATYTSSPEQNLQNLNALADLEHFAYSEGDKAALSERLAAIGRALYGVPELPPRTEESIELKGEARLIPWDGSVIHVVVGDIHGDRSDQAVITLLRDGDGQWLARLPNHPSKIMVLIGETALQLGRNEISANNEYVSRKHLILQAGGRGEILVVDTASANGTIVNHRSYPRPKREDSEVVAENSAPPARRRLFGRRG